VKGKEKAMPLLPSGKNLYISRALILDPDPNFFNCPEGHFWYRTADTLISPPPYPPGTQVVMGFAHAPVPKDREEVKKYIQVLIGLEGNAYYWRGDLLSDFPADGELDEADLAAWNEWLESEGTTDFLDGAIEMCRSQAESNVNNSGRLVVKGRPANEQSDPDEIRLREIGRRIGELESRVEKGRSELTEADGYEIFTELNELQVEILDIRKRSRSAGGVGAYVDGYLNRVLHRYDVGEERFREFLRSSPFYTEAWLELTWCLARQGKLEEAEEAARRAVQVAPEHCGAWGNLAMVLLQRGVRGEARQALDRALEIDPDNERNRLTDLHFDDLLARPEPDTVGDEDELEGIAN
jgi:tetratricopeptide (TPR) repeat protein